MPNQPRRTGAALPFGVELGFEFDGKLSVESFHLHLVTLFSMHHDVHLYITHHMVSRDV